MNEPPFSAAALAVQSRAVSSLSTSRRPISVLISAARSPCEEWTTPQFPDPALAARSHGNPRSVAVTVRMQTIMIRQPETPFAFLLFPDASCFVPSVGHLRQRNGPNANYHATKHSLNHDSQ